MPQESELTQQLDRDYRRMLRMYEALPDPVLFVNRDGVITKVNERTVKFFGRDREMLVSQPVEILMPERYRAHHATHLRGYFGDPETRPMGVHLDIVALQDGGRREIPVTIMLAPLVTGDETEAIAVVRRRIEVHRPASLLLSEIRSYCQEHNIELPQLAEINRLLPPEK